MLASKKVCVIEILDMSGFTLLPQDEMTAEISALEKEAMSQKR